MTETSVQAAAEAARTKTEYLRRQPLGYFVLSLLAGVYVGFGIVLIFAIGAPLMAAGSPAAKLAMGASFGVALSLVVFAGAELFTGNNMVMTIGALRRTASPGALTAIWVVSFAGNLIGSLALAWLVARSGVLGGAPHLEVIQKTVATKMSLPFATLFWRGLLCNWLVCLGVWTAMRSQSETGKLVMIFWCLFAFIGAGFEHSVANMTLLGIGLLQPHGAAISASGFVHNLVPVTLGNIAGGALFVGGAYWLANQPLRLPLARPAEARAAVAAESAAGD
jgi:nitrite transporter NirC